MKYECLECTVNNRDDEPRRIMCDDCPFLTNSGKDILMLLIRLAETAKKYGPPFEVDREILDKIEKFRDEYLKTAP